MGVIEAVSEYGRMIPRQLERLSRMVIEPVSPFRVINEMIEDFRRTNRRAFRELLKTVGLY